MRRLGIIVALVGALTLGGVRPADAGVKHALKHFAHGVGEVVLIATLAVVVIAACASGTGCAFQERK